MSISKIIINIRTELCLSQIELSRELNVSRSCMSQYESGKTIPRMKVLRRIKEFAEAHNISVSFDDVIVRDKRKS